MPKELSFLILALVAALPGRSAAANTTLAAQVLPAKVSYVTSEPVELLLKVTSTSDLTVQVAVRYPGFGAMGHSGLRIWAGKTAPPSAGARDGKGSGVAVGVASSPLIPLIPAQSFSLKIYLQRYLPNLTPGVYDLSYSVDMPCLLPQRSRDCRVSGGGAFRVAVLDTDGGGLTRILAEHAEKLDASEDYWTRRAAEEALCVSGSPAALPYLRDLLRFGLTDSAVPALSKFAGNSDAEEMAIATAREGKPSAAEAALSVLQGWGYALREADFQAILARDSLDLKYAALRYAERAGSRRYISAVAAYLSDPDPGLAELARRVEQTLNTSVKQ